MGIVRQLQEFDIKRGGEQAFNLLPGGPEGRALRIKNVIEETCDFSPLLKKKFGRTDIFDSSCRLYGAITGLFEEDIKFSLKLRSGRQKISLQELSLERGRLRS